MSQQEPFDLMSTISGMSPETAAALNPDEALFSPPVFSYVVESKLKIPGAEKMNGTVVLRFPNLNDDLMIERMTTALGGSSVARMTATLMTCITKAPASWYEMKPGAEKPALNLGRLLDDTVLADLYVAFLDWQRSFR